ncbi:MAG: YegP family protein [Flavobacteriaceae bacterium]|nr:YegP family protein [Flavobacteriaceae bacterium]
MNNPKFQLFKSQANFPYYFRLKAKNGEIILGSEGYTTKQNCQNGIASVKVHAPYDSNYERKDGIGNYTFNLKANNGEIIGRSENYTTRQARENGIEAVKRDAPNAPTEDLT